MGQATDLLEHGQCWEVSEKAFQGAVGGRVDEGSCWA